MKIIQILILAMCSYLVACITTQEGGLPQPAPVAERLKAQLDLARGYLAKQDYARARSPLDSALRLDSTSASVHMLYAALYSGEEEYGLAESHFKKALRYGSKDPRVLNNYGSFLFARSRFQEAENQLKKAAANANYENRAQSFENLGLVQLRLEDLTSAQASFERSVALNPFQPRSHLELTDLLVSKGEMESARSHFDSYRTQARQNARSLCLGYQLSDHFLDRDQSASYALALKKLFPDSAEASECKSRAL